MRLWTMLTRLFSSTTKDITPVHLGVGATFQADELLVRRQKKAREALSQEIKPLYKPRLIEDQPDTWVVPHKD